ncbi:MAG TPA: hypothetical protein VJJ83_04835, partial [Candidatus Babeliales bacterium]|nr:hypothetical protein [Candidatus Babeliales bacterium]
SHNMDEVTELCDRVLVLQQGEIIADDSPAQLARSTSLVRVQLTITSELVNALKYLRDSQLVHTSQANQLTIELDEHLIAQFLTNLGAQQITYSQISIDKPTLEDYFLNIVKQAKTGGD